MKSQIISPEIELMSFNLEKRKSFFASKTKKFTSEQLNIRLSENHEKLKQEKTKNGLKDKFLTDELVLLLEEILVNIKSESFKNGSIIENCLQMLFFELKKTISQFFGNKKNKEEKLLLENLEKIEFLNNQNKSLKQENKILKEEAFEKDGLLRFMTMKNEKFLKQVFEYNTYHFSIIEKIKSLEKISQLLRTVHESTNRIINNIEEKSMLMSKENILMQMFTIHSSTSRIIMIIEDFKLENNCTQIEV